MLTTAVWNHPGASVLKIDAVGEGLNVEEWKEDGGDGKEEDGSREIKCKATRNNLQDKKKDDNKKTKKHVRKWNWERDKTHDKGTHME